MNNDAFFRREDALSELVSTLMAREDAVAISPLVSNQSAADLDPNTQVQIRRCPSYVDMVVAYSCWLRRLPFLRRYWSMHTYQDLMPFSAGRIYTCESINGCCFVIKQDFVEDIGNLDEGTFLYAEELVLALQIRDKQKSCLLHCGEVVDHLQGASTGQTNGSVRWRFYKEQIRSEMYLCRKALGGGLWRRVLLLTVRTLDFGVRFLWHYRQTHRAQRDHLLSLFGRSARDL
jgi:GT2 family glycosyltransferase